MVMIEALACGTPVIGLDNGAIPEVVTHYKTGIIASHTPDNPSETAQSLADAINSIDNIDRNDCRKEFESRFDVERMCREHIEVYRRLSETTELQDQP